MARGGSVSRSARTGRFVSRSTVARWSGRTTAERVRRRNRQQPGGVPERDDRAIRNEGHRETQSWRDDYSTRIDPIGITDWPPLSSGDSSMRSRLSSNGCFYVLLPTVSPSRTQILRCGPGRCVRRQMFRTSTCPCRLRALRRGYGECGQRLPFRRRRWPGP